MSRSLFIVPVVHAEADLGRLADSVRAATDDAAWAEKQKTIGETWQRIAEWCEGLDTYRLKVFQDGLPDDPSAPRIVEELAGKGSPNHRIIQNLIERGANLVGTESPELLVREYKLATAAAAAANADRHPDPRHRQRAASLLAQRDAYIAKTIDKSLAPGEAGVLFIGMLHDVASKLHADIGVSYPLGRLCSDRARATEPFQENAP
ncbi:MAG: hypothetical protein AAFN41_10670 [Planctomycetota bacterium]